MTLKGRPKNVTNVAQELETFLVSSDGIAVLNVLLSSKRCITFEEHKAGKNYTAPRHEYIIDGRGLFLITTSLPCAPNRMLTEWSMDCRSITPEQAVDNYLKYKNPNIESFMPWLRAELDKIAAAAPEQTPTEP